jgi:serine/threonine-protein phosphatase 4 regulatory subunit 4
MCLTGQLLTELEELLKDEEIDVRQSALRAMISLLDFLPSRIRKSRLIPILRTYYASPPKGMLYTLCQLYGDAMIKINDDIEGDVATQKVMATFYRSLATHDDGEVRRLCAFNFPAIMTLTGRLKYTDVMHPILMILLKDDNEGVRRSLSSSFHHIAVMLGARALKILKEAFILLLRDKLISVQDALITNLSTILNVFATSTDDAIKV